MRRKSYLHIVIKALFRQKMKNRWIDSSVLLLFYLHCMYSCVDLKLKFRASENKNKICWLKSQIKLFVWKAKKLEDTSYENFIQQKLLWFVQRNKISLSFFTGNDKRKIIWSFLLTDMIRKRNVSINFLQNKHFDKFFLSCRLTAISIKDFFNRELAVIDAEIRKHS
jgi:hypothetical protein